jgi:general secretion pathway protein G
MCPRDVTAKGWVGRARGRAGFTYGKVLLVLSLFLLLVGAAVVAALPHATICRMDPVKTQIAALGHQLEMYKLNMGRYPGEDDGGLRALLVQPNYHDPGMAEQWAGPYIKAEMLKDPWGNEIHYQLTQPGTPEAAQLPYRLWSSGPDGIDGTDDDIRNWSDNPEKP